MKNLLKKENMVICVLVGILILVIAIPVGEPKSKMEGKSKTSSFFGDVNETDNNSADDTENESDAYQTKYIADLEKKVEGILGCMEGVGQAKVMITLKASKEYIVEKDIPTSHKTSMGEITGKENNTVNENSTEEKTVYTVDENGNEVPYVVKINEPEIEGITVVAEGGANPLVKSDVTAVLQALFSLEAHKIIVVQMK